MQNKNPHPFIFGKSFSRERGPCLKTCSFPGAGLGWKGHIPGGGLIPQEFHTCPEERPFPTIAPLLCPPHGSTLRWGPRPGGPWHRRLPLLQCGSCISRGGVGTETRDRIFTASASDVASTGVIAGPPIAGVRLMPSTCPLCESGAFTFETKIFGLTWGMSEWRSSRGTP